MAAQPVGIYGNCPWLAGCQCPYHPKIAIVKPMSKRTVPFYDLVIEIGITKALDAFLKAGHTVLSRKDNDVADSHFGTSSHGHQVIFIWLQDQGLQRQC
jgi:hypothetical protein